MIIPFAEKKKEQVKSATNGRVPTPKVDHSAGTPCLLINP